MSLRDRLGADLKAAMKGGEGLRVSTIRLVLARMKEVDIAARPKGVERVADDDLIPMLRSMVKQRHDSVALYRQGGREELAEREAAEIGIIEAYLPQGLDEAGLERAVMDAIAGTAAAGPRDIGKVMAALKASHGGGLDMARANALVRARLG